MLRFSVERNGYDVNVVLACGRFAEKWLQSRPLSGKLVMSKVSMCASAILMARNVRSDKTNIPGYSFQKAASNNKRCDLDRAAIQAVYPGFECDVLDVSGVVANGANSAEYRSRLLYRMILIGCVKYISALTCGTGSVFRLCSASAPFRLLGVRVMPQAFLPVWLDQL